MFPQKKMTNIILLKENCQFVVLSSWPLTSSAVFATLALFFALSAVAILNLFKPIVCLKKISST